MELYCQNSGIAVTEWIKEIGGGMNFKRKLFLKLMVVHCFSCRLYGLRTYKKQIKKIAQIQKPD